MRLKKAAEKYLNKLSGKMYLAVRSKIEELKTNPVPGDAVPLKGYSRTYRIRLGSTESFMRYIIMSLSFLLLTLVREGRYMTTIDSNAEERKSIL